MADTQLTKYDRSMFLQGYNYRVTIVNEKQPLQPLYFKYADRVGPFLRKYYPNATISESVNIREVIRLENLAE